MEAPFTGVASAIPSLIWESLENALQANMLRLAKDVAKTLGQPHAPLVEALQAQKVRPYIFEESEEFFQRKLIHVVKGRQAVY